MVSFDASSYFLDHHQNPKLRSEKWKAVINDAMCSSAETGYVDGIKESEKL